jgi:hypothetical protein
MIMGLGRRGETQAEKDSLLPTAYPTYSQGQFPGLRHYGGKEGPRTTDGNARSSTWKIISAPLMWIYFYLTYFTRSHIRYIFEILMFRIG